MKRNHFFLLLSVAILGATHWAKAQTVSPAGGCIYEYAYLDKIYNADSSDVRKIYNNTPYKVYLKSTDYCGLDITIRIDSDTVANTFCPFNPFEPVFLPITPHNIARGNHTLSISSYCCTGNIHTDTHGIYVDDTISYNSINCQIVRIKDTANNEVISLVNGDKYTADVRFSSIAQFAPATVQLMIENKTIGAAKWEENSSKTILLDTFSFTPGQQKLQLNLKRNEQLTLMNERQVEIIAKPTAQSLRDLAIYPIPVSETLFFSLTNNISSIKNIQIVDMQGRQLATSSTQLSPSVMSIATNDLPNGFYILRIQTDKELVMKKIAIER